MVSIFKKRTSSRKAQAVAVEYMVMLSAIAIVVLLGFKKYFPQVRGGSELYFNRAADGIMGPPPACGNGICEAGRLETPLTCCRDCGPGCGYDGH